MAGGEKEREISVGHKPFQIFFSISPQIFLSQITFLTSAFLIYFAPEMNIWNLALSELTLYFRT